MNRTLPTDHRTQPPSPAKQKRPNALARLANWIAARFGEHEQRVHALRVYSRNRVDHRHNR